MCSFVAAVIQHEQDHLNGILYTDRLAKDSDLYDVEEFFKTNTLPEEEGTWKKHKGHTKLGGLKLLTPTHVLLELSRIVHQFPGGGLPEKE